MEWEGKPTTLLIWQQKLNPQMGSVAAHNPVKLSPSLVAQDERFSRTEGAQQHRHAHVYPLTHTHVCGCTAVQLLTEVMDSRVIRQSELF